MKRMFWVCMLVFGLMLSWSTVIAGEKGKSTSWDKKISKSNRFKLVLDGEAALDRETGLVWEKSPDTDFRDWFEACTHCYQREVGGRKGWRLPTIEELASLVDTSNNNPVLPTGHPFTNVQSNWYWSSTTNAGHTSFAWVVSFSSGFVGFDGAKSGDLYVWCVRGGYGHDAY